MSDSLRDGVADPVADGAVAGLVERIARHDESAARRLWRDYFFPLVRVLRRWIGNRPVALNDEEDLALEALFSFCRRAESGAFRGISSRGELWCVLQVTVWRGFLSERRRMARLRGGANLQRTFGSLGRLASQSSDLEVTLTIDDEMNRLAELRRADRLLSILRLVRDGHSRPEIADRLGVSLRTIAREIQMIRRHVKFNAAIDGTRAD